MTRFLISLLFTIIYSVSVFADIYSASSALSRGDYATAAAEFTKLAEAGDDRAQANLGYMYYSGEGVEQDYEKAVYWYKKAAVQGNRDAQYNLAVSYAFGEGVKQNLTEAAIWYRRAGEQNHVVSQYSLGISYAYGEGVPQDVKEAARWFKRAADQGYARAQVHLGSMYHTGEGVEQNYEEAVRWYRMAADRGDATAQYNLGTMYRSGKGVEQNYAQAKRWFRQSADQGYAAAQNELASLERSAAANIATRTIQAKPELLPGEGKQEPEKKQARKKVAASTVAKSEPIKEPETISNTSEVKDKEPLFTVEKKDLLSIDESELDIEQAAVDDKAEETVAEQEPTPIATDIETPYTPLEPDDTATTAVADTDEAEVETEEESEGFFSRLFSADTKDEEEIETVSVVPDTSEDEDVIIAKLDKPEPVIEEIE
ncbi:MAG: sel1 repeat family protein, partial [Proteobacteria bacterium]|nr:sel1 repeat family protein [Pseudomonadota bacterium]